MKNKKKDEKMGEPGERRAGNAVKPQRKEPQGLLEDMPLKKSPDVDRIVDDIILKYDDFGLTDRG